MSAVFAQFGWGEIDYYLMFGEIEERIADGGTDAIATFADNFTCHTDNIKTGETLCNIAFDRN